jgi:conjugal transfer pilus assembly protein TraD
LIPSPPRPARPPYWTLPALFALLAVPLPVAIAVLAGAVAVSLGVAAARGVRTRSEDARASAEPGQVALGRIAAGERQAGRAVVLGERDLGAHGLILGATGAGKSTSLLRILGERVRAGAPVVALDLKGSPAFERALREACQAAGRPLRVWRPGGPEQWNPLAHGDPSELKDKLIGAERFTEPHYQRLAERYLQLAFGVLAARGGGPPTLDSVLEVLEPRRLALAAAELPAGQAARIADYVATLGPDGTSAVRGLATRLALLAESGAGRSLGGDPRGIDLRGTLDGHEVVLFSLNSSTLGGLAAQLGTLAVQDLTTASGHRLEAGGGPLATVAIDEFSGLAGGHVLRLLARGRESGIGLLLATQEFADLDRVAPGFAAQVSGNTPLKIIHRQDEPVSARRASELTGAERVWEETHAMGVGAFSRGRSRGTRRLVERPLVHPDRIASLPVGDAVVITKVPGRQVRITAVDGQAPSAARGDRTRGDLGR